MQTTAFLVLRPDHNYRGDLISVEVSRMTKTKPSLKVSEVAIELVIDVESRLFEQFLPRIEIKLDGQEKLITPVVDIETQPQPEPEDPDDDD